MQSDQGGFESWHLPLYRVAEDEALWDSELIDLVSRLLL
jgi:hypothetical protein